MLTLVLIPASHQATTCSCGSCAETNFDSGCSTQSLLKEPYHKKLNMRRLLSLLVRTVRKRRDY